MQVTLKIEDNRTGADFQVVFIPEENNFLTDVTKPNKSTQPAV